MEKNQDKTDIQFILSNSGAGSKCTNIDLHELYLRHLTEAALAYYQATGKDRFKDHGKSLDHILDVFCRSKSTAFSFRP